MENVILQRFSHQSSTYLPGLNFLLLISYAFHFIRTCHLCCSAAPSLLRCGPSAWQNFHNLHTHSTSLQQRNIAASGGYIHSVWKYFDTDT